MVFVECVMILQSIRKYYHTDMPQLNLKPHHKAIRNYYATLQQYSKHNITHEGAVSNPFAFLLDACAKQVDATLVSQYAMRTPVGNRIVLDGVILDAYGLPFAYWEAKDMDDNLQRAVEEKRVAGYPLDNILFQNPQRGILYQNYEKLRHIETRGMPIDWRVEKMKFSRDKTQLKYNDFLTLDGIPVEAFDYRLGNRSALEWVVDQYRVKTDKRSGIVNDPNRVDQPRYIVDLIGRVINVSLKTVEIVEDLSPFFLDN